MRYLVQWSERRGGERGDILVYQCNASWVRGGSHLITHTRVLRQTHKLTTERVVGSHSLPLSYLQQLHQCANTVCLHGLLGETIDTRTGVCLYVFRSL